MKTIGLSRPLRPLAAALTVLATVTVAPQAHAYVALMAGQRARPLNGSFNKVPVLHSNQPEEVEGPGILITTSPGVSYAAENGQPLRNVEYNFNGDFGLHLHHKYFPSYRSKIRAGKRRSELTLGVILTNPGNRPVNVQLQRGAVRNSFQAPYHSNHLMGVKPLGRRPWNTGPGDATAVQMLREQLDREFDDGITIPARSRLVLFKTQLPALGIANALLKGRSNGPFQMAVVAARQSNNDADLMAVLDQRRLAPGRVYLNRVADIKSRRVFSRVGGVAIGDRYQASLEHDLRKNGALHVPLTSTSRHHFGTRDIQVNPLATRMIDSSIDNIGTYGVRFDIDLKLTGSGPYELVLSHPSAGSSRAPFVAFRGSLQVKTADGLEEMHLGMRSGESHALTTLNLRPQTVNPVRVSLVYPADSTPGHLLSVVPSVQLARLQKRPTAPKTAAQRATAPRPATVQPVKAKPPVLPPQPDPPKSLLPAPAKRPPPQPHVPASKIDPGQPLLNRYQQAMEAQKALMRELMGR